MKSIIQTDRERCYICGRNTAFEPLDEHHVYAGANRKLSEKYGLEENKICDVKPGACA